MPEIYRSTPEDRLASSQILPEQLSFSVNGSVVHVGVEPHATLTDVLREKLELTGTKETCGEGACGSCTVLVDGVPTLSCITMASTVEGCEIETVESLADGNELHAIQEAFLEERGTQCGYCSSGFMMATKRLLEENPSPSDEEIKKALSGNICRCSAYEHIINSVKVAARKLQEGPSS